MSYFNINLPIKEIVINLSKLLSTHNIPPTEARYLLKIATLFSLEDLVRNEDKFLSSEQLDKLNHITSLRIQHLPLAYIEGKKEFYGNEFFVDKSVLIPRADSEILIDSILNNKFSILENKKEISVLDLGIGSGCLLITLITELLKKNYKASGLGVDINDLTCATINIDRYNLNDYIKLKRSDWFTNVTEKFDIILANPPYISIKEIHLMAQETLLYEPKEALFAEDNGLFSYRKIASKVKEYLNKDGILAVEIGFKQKDEVTSIFQNEGLKLSEAFKDLSNHDRVLLFVNNASSH